MGLNSSTTKGTKVHEGMGARLLVPVAKVFDERQRRSDHGQPNQNGQSRFVILGEETQNMAAVVESQVGVEEVAEPAAERQGCQELFARILHGPRRQQKWKERKWRRH